MREAMAVVGLVLITTGLALWSIPTALVVLGTLLLALAVGPLLMRGDGQ